MSTEDDGNLSDTDLIYVGEEHIDLESNNAFGIDELVSEQEQEDISFIISDGGDSRCHGETRDDKDISVGKVDGLMIVDEWDDEDINSDDDKDEFSERDKDAMNPEDIEKAMLSMPSMKVLMDDVGHLKQNRKVIIHPLTMEDINSPVIHDILTWSALEETKLNFIRSHKDGKDMIGILVLTFTTCGSANKAIEILKAWKDNLQIKAESNSNRLVDDFISDSRGKKRWTDNVAILKNLADDVKVESVKKLFPQAEEIILHLDLPKHKETNATTIKDTPASAGSGSATSLPTPRGYAYLVFPCDEVVKAEVAETAAKKLELSGHRLLLLNYRNPVNTVPRTYLRLRERKIIMRHLDKCLKISKKALEDPSVKLPEYLDERIELCKSRIEKDNKCRKEMDLPEPSLEELRRMTGLPALDPTSCHKILVRFGIIKDRQIRSPTPQKERRERNNITTRPFNRSTFNRASPIRRRSPYEGQRSRGMDQYHRSRNVGPLTMPQPLLGNSPSAVNPLAFMMQQNLGMIGNGGVLNSNLMVPQGMNLVGGSSLLGSHAMPSMSGAAENGKSKMLRLDETGNYHTADGSRGMLQYDDRMRRGMDVVSRNQTRRKRSVSPLTRSRQDYDLLASKRANIDEGVSTPMSLLLNLSQMLSHGVDSRNQNLQRGKRLPYERSYHGNQL